MRLPSWFGVGEKRGQIVRPKEGGLGGSGGAGPQEPGRGRGGVARGPDWLALYLEEDLGPGDATAAALPPGAHGKARMAARERLLVAGLPHAAELFRRTGAVARP